MKRTRSRKTPSSDVFPLMDLIPEMICEVAQYLDPLSCESLRTSCHKMEENIAWLPLADSIESSEDTYKRVVLRTASLKFAVIALSSVKKEMYNMAYFFWHYGRNPNHKHWGTMTAPLFKWQKNALYTLDRDLRDFAWTLPLIWGLMRVGNDAVLEEIKSEDVTAYKLAVSHYEPLMMSILERSDAVDFISSNSFIPMIDLIPPKKYNFSHFFRTSYRYPTLVTEQAVTRFFQLVDSSEPFHDYLFDYMENHEYTLGGYSKYPPNMCCALLEHLKVYFADKCHFTGNWFDILANCVSECDADTLERCFKLELYKTHESRPLVFNSYFQKSNVDPVDFEKTWNVLCANKALQFTGTKIAKFEYAICIKKNWGHLVRKRFKTLLRRDAKKLRGGEEMLKIVKAIDNV